MNQPFALSRGASTQSVEAPLQELPAFIETVLADFGLLGAFLARPHPRRQGLVMRIVAAGRPDLRDERIAEMLDELVSAPGPSPS